MKHKIQTDDELNTQAKLNAAMCAASNLKACDIISSRDIERVAKAIVSVHEQIAKGDRLKQLWVERAENYYQCKVVKCKQCIGNGSYWIEAGDGQWSEDCEVCNQLGYVPEGIST